MWEKLSDKEHPETIERGATGRVIRQTDDREYSHVRLDKPLGAFGVRELWVPTEDLAVVK